MQYPRLRLVHKNPTFTEIGILQDQLEGEGSTRLTDVHSFQLKKKTVSSFLTFRVGCFRKLFGAIKFVTRIICYLLILLMLFTDASTIYFCLRKFRNCAFSYQPSYYTAYHCKLLCMLLLIPTYEYASRYLELSILDTNQ